MSADATCSPAGAVTHSRRRSGSRSARRTPSSLRSGQAAQVVLAQQADEEGALCRPCHQRPQPAHPADNSIQFMLFAHTGGSGPATSAP